jgi:hypothetical protein
MRIWISENGDEVRCDVEKYNQRGFTGGKYLCIVEYTGQWGRISNEKLTDITWSMMRD